MTEDESPRFEFKARVATQKRLAVLLYPETAEKGTWVPKSVLTHEHRQDVETAEIDDWLDISIPQWFAESKGMV